MSEDNRQLEQRHRQDQQMLAALTNELYEMKVLKVELEETQKLVVELQNEISAGAKVTLTNPRDKERRKRDYRKRNGILRIKKIAQSCATLLGSIGLGLVVMVIAGRRRMGPLSVR